MEALQSSQYLREQMCSLGTVSFEDPTGSTQEGRLWVCSRLSQVASIWATAANWQRPRSRAQELVTVL